MSAEIGEQWIDLENGYSVSDTGKVKNNKNGRVLKSKPQSNGYCYITLNGKQLLLHRVVATAFFNEPQTKLHVNHIDGNKANNCISNLELCTQKENNRHAFRTGLNRSLETSVENMNRATRKPVIQICLESGSVVKTFVSLSEARRITRITSIHDCLCGRQKTAGGYRWEYMKLREAQTA